MPYCKMQKPTLDRLGELLYGNRVRAADLGSAIGCSERTARNKLHDPATLTVGELRAINRKLHIPLEELRGAL